MSTTNMPDSVRPALQDISDEELFAEVRARITDIVNELEGLQLLRAFEAISGIAQVSG